jgi:hypothetical protein
MNLENTFIGFCGRGNHLVVRPRFGGLPAATSTALAGGGLLRSCGRWFLGEI